MQTSVFTIAVSLASSLVVAITTTSLTNYFTERRAKKDRINEALAKMFSAGRAYRECYVSFVEYDIDFKEQQNRLKNISTGFAISPPSATKQSEENAVPLIAKALNDKTNEKYFDLYRGAAETSQRAALDYRNKLSDSRQTFLQSAFVLSSLMNKEFHKYKMQDKVNEIIGFRVSDHGTNFDEAKKEIDKSLLPHLEHLEKKCDYLMWAQNSPKVAATFQNFKDHLKTCYERMV